MIAYLKGEVSGIYEGLIVLEVGGIGYNVFMPQSSIDSIRGIGTETKIYTYLSVREDAMWLYGFLTKDDLDFFKLLIQVNGIGPKGALGILSVMSVDDLKFSILSSDAKTISKAPGIGAKTAQRIIIDLKDKISLEDTFEHKLNNINDGDSDPSPIRQEAVEALCALGYSSSDALKACRQVEIGENDDVENVLKAALKYLI